MSSDPVVLPAGRGGRARSRSGGELKGSNTVTGTDSPTADDQGFLQSRLGLPRFRGNGRLVSASAIDSLGTGLVLAFVLVYFARTTTLSLPAIGGAITLARLLAVPTAITVGPLIDRWGARLTALAGNVLCGLGYAGFLLCHQAWHIVLAAWLAQVGAVTYWTSSTGLVVLASNPGERPRWFAALNMVRYVGLGLGGAIGAFLVGIGNSEGLRIIVIGNVASYAIAATLLARWRPTHPAPVVRAGDAKDPDAPKTGYRTVLRDRRYMLLVAINIANVFASLVLSLLLAVFITDGLHRDAWIAGVLLVMNSVQVTLTQTMVTRWVERFRPTRAIAAGTLLKVLAFGIFATLVAAPGWLVLAGLVVSVLLFSLGVTVAMPFAEDLSVSLAPEGMRGRYLAVYQLSWTTGQTAAPALFTLLLSHNPRWPWFFLIVLCLAAVPALLRLERLMGPGGSADGQVTPAAEAVAA
jgi:MFS family permease